MPDYQPAGLEQERASRQQAAGSQGASHEEGPRPPERKRAFRGLGVPLPSPRQTRGSEERGGGLRRRHAPPPLDRHGEGVLWVRSRDDDLRFDDRRLSGVVTDDLLPPTRDP